jgi:hypothetical protein
VLDGVGDWYRAQTGTPLAVRRGVDNALDAQSRPSVPPAEFERIRAVLERMYAADGRG